MVMWCSMTAKQTEAVARALDARALELPHVRSPFPQCAPDEDTHIAVDFEQTALTLAALVVPVLQSLEVEVETSSRVRAGEEEEEEEEPRSLERRTRRKASIPREVVTAVTSRMSFLIVG